MTSENSSDVSSTDLSTVIENETPQILLADCGRTPVNGLGDEYGVKRVREAVETIETVGADPTADRIAAVLRDVESEIEAAAASNPYEPADAGRMQVRERVTRNSSWLSAPLRRPTLRALGTSPDATGRILVDLDGGNVVLRLGDAGEGDLMDIAVSGSAELGPKVLKELGAEKGDTIVAIEENDHVRLEIDEERLFADGGGVTWTDLTGFKRDLLEAIRRLDNDGETTYGLAIKRELQRFYGEDINHGRLYPNLDDLVDAGLVEKGELDKRTNSYKLTSEAESMLDHRARLLADACGVEQPVADGGDR